MEGFLARVTRDLLSRHEDIGRLALILPSRRSNVFLKRELSRQLQKPSWSPHISTLEDFFLEQLGLQLCEGTALPFLLYESYQATQPPPREDFAQFSQWAPDLLSEFDEIDRNLVDAHKLFQNLADSERIRHWDPENPEPTPAIKRYLEQWGHMPALYRHFYQKLLERGEVYSGIAFREMQDRLPRHLEELRQRFSKIVFVGFSALNRAEENIMLQLLEEDLAEFYWDTDAYYLDQRHMEAGEMFRKSPLVKRLREKDRFNYTGDYWRQKSGHIRVIPCPGEQAQAVTAMHELRPYLSEDPNEVALVLADENQLPVVLNNLSDEVSGLNITMGLPLAQNPAGTFFGSLIEMAVQYERQPRHDEEERPAFSHRLWDELLGHYLCSQGSVAPQQLEPLRLRIREQNLLYLSPGRVRQMSEDLLPEALTDTLEVLSGKDLARTWQQLARLAQFLHEKTVHQNAQLQSLYGFYKIFNRLADLCQSYTYLSDWETAQRYYQQLLRSEHLHLTGDPLSGLQIMGLLETRALDFKHLVITSLNEGVLPRGRTGGGLIPFDLKTAFGLPTHQHRDAVYAYHFYRLLQRAETVSLLYDSRTEGLRSGEPSRFIRQLQIELPEYEAPRQLSEQVFHFPVEVREPVPHIEKTPALMADLEALAARGFSPTALSDYVRDPVQFYKRRLLHLKEPEEVEEEIAPNTQGEVIHQILEEAYQDTRQRSLDHPALRYSREHCQRLVEDKLRELTHIPYFNRGKNLLVREILTGMLYHFWAAEKERLKKAAEEDKPLRLLGLEEKLSATLTLTDGREVQLRGTIDRIEQQDGLTRIIDYKTGFVDRHKLSLNNLTLPTQNADYTKALQLLTYAWMYFQNHPECETLEAGILSLRNNAEGLMSLKLKAEAQAGTGSENPTRALMENFAGELRQLISEILDPAVAFVQDPELLRDSEDAWVDWLLPKSIL